MPKPTPHAALAATLGLTTRELSEYRYQGTRTPHSVYAIGDRYYCARAAKPVYRSDELGWTPLKDQHWAGLAGTVAWQGMPK